MIRRVALLLLFAVSTARADTPTLDLTLTWDEGESSSDFSSWKTTITVTGTKLHYSSRYSGRNTGMPGTEARDVNGVVKDPKKVATLLQAFDQVSPPKTKSTPQRGRYAGGCLTRGTVKRCVRSTGGAPDTDEVKALREVLGALLDGVKVM
jgi:hypothetical protein